MTDAQPKVINATTKELRKLLAGPYQHCQHLAVLGPQAVVSVQHSNSEKHSLKSRLQSYDLVVHLLESGVYIDQIANELKDLQTLAIWSLPLQKQISAITGFRNLSSLSFRDNDINAEGAKTIASLCQLTSLDLRNNKIDVEGALAIASLSQLTKLDLINNQIGMEGVIAIASLDKLGSLSLAGNGIGKEGAQVIASLNQLTFLGLGDNKIGTEGAHAIASLEQLITLDLARNNIGVEGARAIASLTELKDLFFGGNKLVPKHISLDQLNYYFSMGNCSIGIKILILLATFG